MTHEERIQRINELARKSRADGLTKEEMEEQKQLRQEYLAVFRQNFKQQLDSIRFVDEQDHEHCDCGCNGHEHHEHKHEHSHKHKHEH